MKTFNYFDFRSQRTRYTRRKVLTRAILLLPAHEGCFYPEITRTQNRVYTRASPSRNRIYGAGTYTSHSRCIKNTDKDVVRDNTKRQLLFTFRAGISARSMRCNPFPSSSRRFSACVRACVRARQSIDLNGPGVTDGKSGEKRVGFHNKRHTQTRAHGRRADVIVPWPFVSERITVAV